MKYAMSAAVIKRGTMDVSHTVGVIEATSDDEAFGKATRVAHIHFPDTLYHKHHVVIQSCDIVWEG